MIKGWKYRDNLCTQRVQSNSGAHSGAWLVSFGDLLTLMLVFFLSIITFGPLNRNGEEQASQEITDAYIDGQLESSTAQLGLASGTALAIAKPKESKRRLVFLESDFEKGTEKLSKLAWQNVNEQIMPGTYLLEEVGFSMCSQSDKSENWYQAMSRVLTLRSQLLDAGISADVLTLESLGPYCEVLQNRFDEPNAVGVLNITLKEIERG